MKKTKWIKGMSLLAAMTMLFGCEGDNSSSLSSSEAPASSEEPASSAPIAETGIKGDILALSSSHNLTISIGITTSSGAVGLSYKNYYSPTYVYSEDFFSGSWGYIEGDTGIYPVSVNEEDSTKLIAGEVLQNDDGSAKKGLWNNDLFPYFSDLNIDEFPETTGEYTLTNKMNILTMLDIYGFERTRYLEVSRIVVHGGESLADFTINMTLGNTIYRLSVTDASSASSSMINTFLEEGGKAYVPDENLVKMRTLFEADNYNRDVLNYETEESQGTEHFTPNYFYGDYASTVAVPYGLMRFANQQIRSGSTTYDMNGCYYFTIQSNQVVLSASQPYNSSTNIADVCFYLHDPLLFSSFEYCTYENNKYVVTNEEVLNDFAVNNQVYDDVTELGASFHRLEISLFNINDEDAEVEFLLYYGRSEAQLYSLKYRFMDFGKANVALIDNFLDSVLVK